MNQQNNFALLVVLLSSILSYTIGQNRIIGGLTDNIYTNRHSVAIFHKRNYKCVGSIISTNLVLTVAHCVKPLETRHILVKASVTNLWEDKGEPHRVDTRYVHPRYNPETGFMDLSVLDLVESFQETPSVCIIELCREPIPPGKWMQISGWGSCNVRTSHPCSIIQSKLVQIQQCWNAEISADLAGTILFAAADSKDLSVGDTGAGGVFNGKLCAVAQRVMDNSPDIYIDITSEIARSFIDDLIEEDQ